VQTEFKFAEGKHRKRVPNEEVAEEFVNFVPVALILSIYNITNNLFHCYNIWTKNLLGNPSVSGPKLQK